MANENIKINFLHTCDNAFFSDDKKLSIIGIFDLIHADRFPALNPKFSIAISVTGQIYDKKRNIEIISPNGNIIVSSEMPTYGLEGKPKTNLVVNLIGVVFPEAGAYRIIFKVNDERISPDRNDIITVN